MTGGPVQYIAPPSPPAGFGWRLIGAISASLITMAIGFLGGATWSHNTRITALETFRATDKENQDKLETRVQRLEDRK